MHGNKTIKYVYSYNSSKLTIRNPTEHNIITKIRHYKG